MLEQALWYYSLAAPRCTLAGTTNNRVYAVVDGEGTRYALRLCHPGYDEVGLQRELSWLAALGTETDLHIPTPVPTRDNTLYARLNDEPRFACLFRWVEGTFLDADLTPDHLSRVGAFTARLHQHGARFTWPHHLAPPRRDAAAPLDQFLTVELARRVYNAEEIGLFERVVERIQAAMRELGHGADVAGVLHADMHQWNYLFCGDQVGAIDFEDCRWGYYVYDMACTMANISTRADYAALEAAYRDGYRRVQALPPGTDNHLETFIMLRTIDTAEWILNWEDPHHMAFGPPFLRDAVRRFHQFLRYNR